MRNQGKNSLRSSRLVYQNMGGQPGQKEQFEVKTEEVLEGYEQATEKNVRDRLKLGMDVDRTLEPIKDETERFNQTIAEMNEERLRRQSLNEK